MSNNSLIHEYLDDLNAWYCSYMRMGNYDIGKEIHREMFRVME